MRSTRPCLFTHSRLVRHLHWGVSDQNHCDRRAYERICSNDTNDLYRQGGPPWSVDKPFGVHVGTSFGTAADIGCDLIRDLYIHALLTSPESCLPAYGRVTIAFPQQPLDEKEPSGSRQ